MDTMVIQEEAAQSLKGRLGAAIIACLIFIIVCQSGSLADEIMSLACQIHYNLTGETVQDMSGIWAYIYDSDSYENSESSQLLQEYIDYDDSYNAYGYQTPTWLEIVKIVQWILTIPVSVGMAAFFLGYVKGEDNSISKKLFGSYNKYIKILGVKAYKSILITIFTLLLIIPGIIAAYSYSMTDYILADNEDIGISDAVYMSSEMMRGYKKDLFMLSLSFLGWMILSALTCGILYIAYVAPYYNATMAVFYNKIKDSYIEANTSTDDSFSTDGSQW